MRPDAEAGQEQQDGLIAEGLGTLARPGGEDSLHLRDGQAGGEWGMVHSRGVGTAASKPGASSPRNTRKRRSERTALLGNLRPPPCLVAASCWTNAVRTW